MSRDVAAEMAAHLAGSGPQSSSPPGSVTGTREERLEGWPSGPGEGRGSHWYLRAASPRAALL